MVGERRGQGNEPLGPFSVIIPKQQANQQLETNVQSRQSSKKAKVGHHTIF
jgi:hypothetical protein